MWSSKIARAWFIKAFVWGFCNFIMDLSYSSQASGWMFHSKKGAFLLHENTVKHRAGARELQLLRELWPRENTPIWPLRNLIMFLTSSFFLLRCARGGLRADISNALLSKFLESERTPSHRLKGQPLIRSFPQNSQMKVWQRKKYPVPQTLTFYVTHTYCIYSSSEFHSLWQYLGGQGHFLSQGNLALRKQLPTFY